MNEPNLQEIHLEMKCRGRVNGSPCPSEMARREDRGGVFYRCETKPCTEYGVEYEPVRIEITRRDRPAIQCGIVNHRDFPALYCPECGEIFSRNRDLYKCINAKCDLFDKPFLFPKITIYPVEP
jgi:hypothetical protein